MSILVFVVAIALLGFGIYWTSESEVGELLAMLGLCMFVISLGMIIWNSTDVVRGRTYEKKIEMYQKENKRIESQVDIVVQKYMQHEDKTFEAAKSENSMTLVSLYPDLKSDSLVKEQIQIYNKNNSKIKSLKESQIDVTTAKWWLYFGG
jgi:hypothetical protein